MFRVHLGDLDRRGSLRIQHRIPADDALWAGTDLNFAEPVEVDLTLRKSGTDQVVARGRLVTVLRSDCRRCLAKVERAFELPLELAWIPQDELGEEAEDADGLRTLPADANELDLGEAVREELVLAVPRYTVCREDCKGLCPQCGTNWNEGDCDCARAEPDPRWAALRALEQE